MKCGIVCLCVVGEFLLFDRHSNVLGCFLKSVNKTTELEIQASLVAGLCFLQRESIFSRTSACLFCSSIFRICIPVCLLASLLTAYDKQFYLQTYTFRHRHMCSLRHIHACTFRTILACAFRHTLMYTFRTYTHILFLMHSLPAYAYHSLPIHCTPLPPPPPACSEIVWSCGNRTVDWALYIGN